MCSGWKKITNDKLADGSESPTIVEYDTPYYTLTKDTR